jgi:hypothetical protein
MTRLPEPGAIYVYAFGVSSCKMNVIFLTKEHHWLGSQLFSNNEELKERVET